MRKCVCWNVVVRAFKNQQTIQLKSTAQLKSGDARSE